MKFFILAILIGSFVGIALLGSAAVSCTPAAGPHCCLADAISGADCPANDPVAFINFHFDFLKDYSKAVLGHAPLSSALLAALLFLLAIKMRITSGKEAGALAVSRNSADRRKTKGASPLKRSIARWLALHEIRDPHAPVRAHDLPTAPRSGFAW